MIEPNEPAGASAGEDSTSDPEARVPAAPELPATDAQGPGILPPDPQSQRTPARGWAKMTGLGQQRPGSSIDERLAGLRARCRASINTLGVIGILPSLAVGSAASQFLSIFQALTVMALEAILPSGGAGEALYSIMFFFVQLLFPLTIGGLAAWLFWKFALSYYARIYWRTTQELDSSGLMALVVNEDWTRLLHAEIQDQISLKWMSPPEPRSMEQQLEFAATYYDQLRKMQHARGQLDASNLWSGALGWFTGQRSWCFCACLINSCGVLALPFWAISGIYYVQKIAVTTAYCDFLLRDGPYAGPLPEILKLLPAGMRSRNKAQPVEVE